jgi:predicted nucleic acid-binding Zn finger protein
MHFIFKNIYGKLVGKLKMFFSFVNIFIYLGHKHAKVKNLFCECKKYIIVNFGGLKVGYVL